MISTQKLIKMARKWQRVAALKRKRISLPRASGDVNQTAKNAKPLADKGHFVVYTVDNQRFVFPIAYLNNPIIRKLFKMSEEEFGLPSDGPITLPCDAALMEHVVSLIQHVDRNSEKAMLVSTMLVSIASNKCALLDSLHQGHSRQQLLVC